MFSILNFRDLIVTKQLFFAAIHLLIEGNWKGEQF